MTPKQSELGRMLKEDGWTCITHRHRFKSFCSNGDGKRRIVLRTTPLSDEDIINEFLGKGNYSAVRLVPLSDKTVEVYGRPYQV